MILFLFLILFCLLWEGFFTMFEMAAVSFDRVRLEYYISKGNKRAIWLGFLLKKPSRLFGTTLIGIDVALQVGSESARCFYESIHLNPDMAPITQVLIVVIFGELVPLFAARKSPEKIALLFVPVIYLISKLFLPFTRIIDLTCRLASKIVGPTRGFWELTRDEVQRAFEKRSKEDSLGEVIGRIFSLKGNKIRNYMQPLEVVNLISNDATIREAKELVNSRYMPFLLLYKGGKRRVSGIVYVKELIFAEENRKLADIAVTPFFLYEEASVLEALKYLKKREERVFVILSKQGDAVGILGYDHISDQLFGSVNSCLLPIQRIIEKRFSGETKIDELNMLFGLNLAYSEAESLGDLVYNLLGRRPLEGESVLWGPFELIVEEVSFLGIRKVLVRTTS